MRRIGFLIVLALAFCLTPTTALAEGEATPTPPATPAPSSAPTATQAAAAQFVLDNQNVYEGMDKSYQQGYTPTVKNGKATIVLPLLATANMQGSALLASPNLGNTDGSPFAFQNMQLTVTKAPHAINGGTATQSAYLVRFELALVPGRLNGVYPVGIDVQANGPDGTVIQQSFTAYVTITDGKDPNAQPTIAATPKPTPQPKVLLGSYQVQPDVVQAGGEFTATVTLKNTHERSAVQNMTVSVSTDSPSLTLLNESNSFFIKRLEKNATVDLVLKFRSDLNTPPQRYTVTLNMDYNNAEAMTLTGSGSFAVHIVQPLRVDMAAPELAATVNTGDTFPLGLQVMNLGRGAVYNVRCQVLVPGLVPSGAAFMGNMEAGTAATQKVDIYVGTRDMGADKSTGKYGLTQGVVQLTYEDSEGKEYTTDIPLSTTIQEAVIAQTQAPAEEKPQMGGQWWVSAAVGAAVIAALAVLLVRRRQRGAA